MLHASKGSMAVKAQRQNKKHGQRLLYIGWRLPVALSTMRMLLRELSLGTTLCWEHSFVGRTPSWSVNLGMDLFHTDCTIDTAVNVSRG